MWQRRKKFFYLVCDIKKFCISHFRLEQSDKRLDTQKKKREARNDMSARQAFGELLSALSLMAVVLAVVKIGGPHAHDLVCSDVRLACDHNITQLQSEVQNATHACDAMTDVISVSNTTRVAYQILLDAHNDVPHQLEICHDKTATVTILPVIVAVLFACIVWYCRGKLADIQQMRDIMIADLADLQVLSRDSTTQELCRLYKQRALLQRLRNDPLNHDVRHMRFEFLRAQDVDSIGFRVTDNLVSLYTHGPAFIETYLEHVYAHVRCFAEEQRALRELAATTFAANDPPPAVIRYRSPITGEMLPAPTFVMPWIICVLLNAHITKATRDLQVQNFVTFMRSLTALWRTSDGDLPLRATTIQKASIGHAVAESNDQTLTYARLHFQRTVCIFHLTQTVPRFSTRFFRHLTQHTAIPIISTTVSTSCADIARLLEGRAPI
jgi:hypothetical protein